MVTKGPWLGRDGFVAETAVQFDRVNSMIARLERELENSRKTISEVAEDANRTRRFQAFEETLKNSREYKITDLQRRPRKTANVERPETCVDTGLRRDDDGVWCGAAARIGPWVPGRAARARDDKRGA